MNPNLKVTLIQSAIIWEDAAANRSHFETLIRQAGPSDLFVLPETFTTGFSMKPSSLAEAPDGPTVAWMQSLAESQNAVIAGSLIIKESGNYYNRLIWAAPDGTLSYYNKRHLFTMGGEHHEFKGGKERPVFELKSWKICPQICYDLRFPVWSRNDRDYDLLLYIANWPAKRAHHWTALLRARAIENLSWVVAVNRIGDDGNGVAHSGNSTLISPVGDVLFENEGEAITTTQTLDGDLVKATRAKFAFLDDQDAFDLS